MAHPVWTINAANAVQWFEMKHPLTKQPVTDAVVTARLRDKTSDAEIAGSEFSVPAVDAPNGHYGGLSPPLALTFGMEYLLEVEAESGGAIIGRRRGLVVAGYEPLHHGGK